MNRIAIGLMAVAVLSAGVVSAQERYTAPVGKDASAGTAKITKYVLTVGNLERTVAFYQGLGMEAPANQKLKQPAAVPPIAKMTGSPDGTMFRNAFLKIPGTDFQFEFVEFTNFDRHPAMPRMQDPGAAMLSINVRDMDAALAAAKQGGGKVITLGGTWLPTGADGKSKEVFVQDPDGFFVEFRQTAAAPDASAPAGNILNANYTSVVDDAEKAANFYKDHFGMEVKVNDWRAGGTPLKLVGLDKGEVRTARVSAPGGKVVWQFFSFRGVDRKPYTQRVADPGTAQFGFQVTDLDAALATFKSAGSQLVSTEAMRSPAGGGTAFMRDPSGVLVEVSQPAPPKAK